MKLRGIPVHVVLLVALALAMLGLAACGQTASPTATPAPKTGSVGMANPAAVYCQQQGHTLETRSDQAGNQYGICILGEKAECGDWAYFRHECGPLAGAATAVTVTQVITYAAIPAGGSPREGTCMGSSLAVWRDGAWRCTAGNDIHDPCFALAGAGDSLVCDADPTVGTPGLTLKLTSPLPAAQLPTETAGHAWLLELADGTVCGFATGATGGVGDKRINYLCRSADPSQRLAILGDLQPGTVWMADKGLVVTGDQGPTIKETTKTPIRRLWR